MTPILLAMQYWKYITIALLSVFLLISIFYINNLRGDIDLLSVEHDLEITQMKAEYVDKAREIERQAHAQQIEAVNEYKKREEIILADAASSRDAVDSLSDTLKSVTAAAKSDASIRDRYIDTSSRILQECSSSYSELAETTERLDATVRLLANSRK